MYLKLNLLHLATFSSLLSFLPSFIIATKSSQIHTKHHASHPTAKLAFIHPGGGKGLQVASVHRRDDGHNGDSDKYADADYANPVNFPGYNDNENYVAASSTQVPSTPTQIQRRDADSHPNMEVEHKKKTKITQITKHVTRTNTTKHHTTRHHTSKHQPKPTSQVSRRWNMNESDTHTKYIDPDYANYPFSNNNKNSISLSNPQDPPTSPEPTPIQRRKAHPQPSLELARKKNPNPNPTSSLPISPRQTPNQLHPKPPIISPPPDDDVRTRTRTGHKHPKPTPTPTLIKTKTKTRTPAHPPTRHHLLPPNNPPPHLAGDDAEPVAGVGDE